MSKRRYNFTLSPYTVAILELAPERGQSALIDRAVRHYAAAVYRAVEELRAAGLSDERITELAHAGVAGMVAAMQAGEITREVASSLALVAGLILEGGVLGQGLLETEQDRKKPRKLRKTA